MVYFPEARAAVWRLRRAIVDLRLAIAESIASKLRLKLTLIDIQGRGLPADEIYRDVVAAQSPTTLTPEKE